MKPPLHSSTSAPELSSWVLISLAASPHYPSEVTGGARIVTFSLKEGRKRYAYNIKYYGTACYCNMVTDGPEEDGS